MFACAASTDNEIIKKSVLFNVLLELSMSSCEGTLHLLDSRSITVGR